jgi:carbonic anhydrase
MSDLLKRVLAANEIYAAQFGIRKELTVTPRLHCAVLTCMDARLDPHRFLGLAEGEAHIIRNAGGRASADAIRSLIVSYKLLGTQEWFVIHHTDCGMESINRAKMSELLRNSLETAKRTPDGWVDIGSGPGSTAGADIDWLEFSDPLSSVIDDVRTLREHPLVPKRIPIYGFIYDVHSGRLEEVTEAMQVGAAG